MRKLLTTAAVLIALIAPATAGDEIKCPKAFDYWMQQVAKYPLSWDAYFECDFTSGTCERGFAASGGRVFQLLAPDRTTVIGAFMCDGYRCYDYYKGVQRNYRSGNNFPIPAGVCDPVDRRSQR